jgi:hypothetical protein
MATQSNNNYTITNVTYSVAAGVNVHTLHPTAVLTITPDAGYSVTAEDFSWANTTLANINTVVFTQDGVNVLCTVTFDNPFNMPSANTVRSLCINGGAVLQRLSVSGSYQAAGSSTNMTIVENSPVPEEIYYELSGVEGYQVFIIEKTYTAANGYYFNGSFNISYTGEEMVAENYNCVETETLDSSGRLTSINIKFYYTFPNNSVVNDKIVVDIPATKQIKVAPVKIFSYSMPLQDASPSGDARVIRVYGTPTATFTLASNNGAILSTGVETLDSDGDTELVNYTTTPTLTIPAAGYFDIDITLPTVTSNAVYCLTLAGGNLISPFPQLNPVCIYQYLNTSLTFTASGTNMTVAANSYVKTYPALSQPAVNSEAYNNTLTFIVTGNSGQSLSLTSSANVENQVENAWSNYPNILKVIQSTISNSNVIALNNVTGLSVGMELSQVDNIITPARKITNISGSNVTIDGAAITISSLTDFPDLSFNGREKSELFLPAELSLNDTSTEVTVTSPGYISKYGDANVTFNLDLADLITVGSVNECKEFNVTVGSQGGNIKYFDCITKSSRVLFVNKGDSNFSICALASPAPVVAGSLSFSASGDVCDNSGVDATCATWSIVYNPTKAFAKSVNVTYIDCVSLQEQTISVGIGSTPTTQCATRQIPVSTDPGDGGATISLTDLTCTP